ncbi:MAG: phosphotransferase [Rhodobacteraceae bacterium]|nr:phosphotransferase [Paracoccaceae bacterium]
MTRAAEIAHFLGQAGWSGASAGPLAGDASARSYLRLHLGGTSAVLMDAPPGSGEDIAPFLAIARYLKGEGYSVPEIIAADPATGLILMEDLGDDLYARLSSRAPAVEPELYDAAVALLVDLHQRTLPADLPPYSAEVYEHEARLLTDWYLPAATGRTLPGDDYAALVNAACARITPDRPCMVLRDYHAENLLWLPDRKGIARVGLLDFQDALAGHPAYDLVSLLEDARRDTSADLRETMLRRYVDATGSDPQAFRLAYATLGAQRNLKIIGIFARLWLRDGKPAYLDLMPRVWAHLQNDLAHPRLAALRDFIAVHVPEPTPLTLGKIRAARHDA